MPASCAWARSTIGLGCWYAIIESTVRIIIVEPCRFCCNDMKVGAKSFYLNSYAITLYRPSLLSGALVVFSLLFSVCSIQMATGRLSYAATDLRTAQLVNDYSWLCS